MKITEYPSATDIDDTNVFIIDGSNGTKKISAEDLRFALFNDIPEMHRNMFRGKNLGSSFTVAQKTAVQNGTFDDLWIGDYWVIGDNTYRIADMDYFIDAGSSGESRFSQHHLVIVPDDGLVNATGHSDRSNKSVGYANLDVAKTGVASAASIISNAFQSNLISVPVFRVTGRNSVGTPIAVSWDSLQADIMNSCMIFGNDYGETMNLSTYNTYKSTEFSLFRLNPKFIQSKAAASYWTSTQVVSDPSLVIVSANGNPSIGTYNSNRSVRPFFCIG